MSRLLLRCCRHPLHGTIRLDDPAPVPSHQVQLTRLVVPGFFGSPAQGFESFFLFPPSSWCILSPVCCILLWGHPSQVLRLHYHLPCISTSFLLQFGFIHVGRCCVSQHHQRVPFYQIFIFLSRYCCDRVESDVKP